MRTRRRNLPTGSLLACFQTADRSRNRGLLFLVDTVEDAAPLARIESACNDFLARPRSCTFEWLAVADQLDLISVDPFLDRSSIFLLEVAELAHLGEEDLRTLLATMVDQLEQPDGELLPAIEGALGGPARGLQLVGRESERRDLGERLSQKARFQLVAARRTGKTSLLRALVEDLEGALYLDLEGVPSPSALAARLGPSSLQQEWDENLAMALRRQGCRFLLLDEMVFFLENLRSFPGKAGLDRADFLRRLAAVVQTLDLGLVLADSRLLGDYLEEQDLDVPFWSDLEKVRLRPLASTALDLTRLLLGTGLVPESEVERAWCRREVDLSLPYPALLFLDELSARTRRGHLQGEAALDQALGEFLQDTYAFREFNERFARIADHDGRFAGRCREVLERLTHRDDVRMPVADTQWSERDLGRFLDAFPILEHAGELRAPRLFARWWRTHRGGAV